MQSVAEFRHNMIDGQLEPNQVLSAPIISAMGVVPREAFVPDEYAQAAYLDEAIPLDSQRYLSPPLLLGQLLELLAPKPKEKILVVGAGTGYAAAVLHQLGCQVVMVEESPELSNRARRALSQQNLSAIEVHTGPIQMGWKVSSPYQKILVDGGLPERPEGLLKQLEQGGRLAYVHITNELPLPNKARGYLTTITKQGDDFIDAQHANVATPALVASEQKEGFDFA